MRDSGKFVLVLCVVAVAGITACIVEPPGGGVGVPRPRPGGPLGPAPNPESEPPRNCERDFDCFVDELCVEELCTIAPPCGANADCFTGVCLDGVCAACYQNGECDSGSVCGDDNRCEAYSTLDFETDIGPLFAEANCVACHHADAVESGSDLRFDVDAADLHRQLMLPGRSRVLLETPAQSTILVAPLREDPPDHPVGVWNRGGPEEALLLEWIGAGASGVDACRHISFGERELDCVAALAPDTACSALGDDALLSACSTCDPVRFADVDFSACVLDAGVLDAGVLDAGVVDAGVLEAGLVDAGVVDAGFVDAGVVDAGFVDAG